LNIFNLNLSCVFRRSAALFVLAVVSTNSQAETKEKEPSKAIERITVTGSRIKQIEYESLNPLIIITSEEIKKKGFNTIYETLQSVSAATGFNIGQAIGGTARNAETINLRGLGPNRTLFLLNGKRVANYPRAFNGDYNVFNISSISVAAVDRIEIVTAASSSIYGSDAMAGVVNILTKRNIDQTSIDVRLSRSGQNDADNERFSVVTGNNKSNYNWTLAIELENQEGLIGKQRDWLDDRFDTPADLSGQSEFRTSLPRALGVFQFQEDWITVDPGEEACNQYDNVSYASFSLGNYCGRDSTGDNSLISDRENFSVYYSSVYNLSNRLSASFDVLYWKSKASRVSTYGWFSEDLKDEVLSSENWEGDGVFIANGGNRYSVSREFQPEDLLDGEGSREHFEEDVLNLSATLEGILEVGFNYEVFISHSIAKNTQSSYQLKKEIASDYFVNQNTTTGELSFDIEHWWKPLGEEGFNTIFGHDYSKSDSSVTTLGASLTGEMNGFNNNDISFATFAEYETSEYDLNEHPRTLGNEGEGWIGKTGTQGSGSRNRYALGIELDAPLTDSFSASASVRYDKYMDNTLVDGSPTYKLGFKWQPLEQLLIRASHGTTFRAPDLHNVFKGISGSSKQIVDFVLLDSCDAFRQGRLEEVLIGNDDPEALTRACAQQLEFSGTYNIFNESSGNLALVEETGYSNTLGLVWSPFDATSISFDLYRLKIKNIVTPDSLENLNLWDWECRSGLRESNAPQCLKVSSSIDRADTENLDTLKIENIRTSFINSAMQKITGFDVAINTSFNIAKLATLVLKSTYTHTLESQSQTFSDEPINKDYRDSYYNSSFRSKINSTITLGFSSFDIFLTHIRYGSLPNSVDFGDWTQLERKRYSPLNLYNLGFNYTISDKQNINFGVQNLFDKKARSDASEQNFPYFKTFAYPQTTVIIGRQFALSYQLTI
jgi:outer membrane receptor protein involved in Fe transport